MQFYEPLAEAVAQVATNFRHPEYLWGIPIAAIVLLLLVTRNLVTYGLDEDGRRRLRRMRTIVFFLRWAAVSLLLIALATPSTVITKENEGNPRALVLVDESGSMKLYDTSLTNHLVDGLSAQLPTTVKRFGSPTESPVGDAALGNTEHLLIISDGNANTGVDIKDVAQVARQNNLSISMITLSPVKYDAAVAISAPESVPLGFPPRIVVEATSTDGGPVPVTVMVDGQQIYAQPLNGEVELDPPLTAGHHKVEARIQVNDANAANNAHYRVVQVLEKPKIYVLSSGRGPLESALAGLFETTVGTRLPADLDQYSAVVINDMSAQSLGSTSRLADYLRDEEGGKYGNGLVVIGGMKSYDRGGYQNTQLEALLPVKVGKPKRNMGDNNLVFVIQISGSTSGVRQVWDPETGTLKTVQDALPVVDIIKAQAASAIESLALENNVGVIVFGVSTAGESYGSAEEAIGHSVVKIADIKPLYKQKKEVIDSVSRVQGGGTTAPDLALRAAVDMLRQQSGSKTIIFLTNGRFSAGLGDVDAGAKSDVEQIVASASRQYGIKTHVIGVGSADYDAATFTKKVDEEFLTNMAVRADGLYDRATNMARLLVKYGDPNDKGFGDDFRLVTLSLTHFITRDVELDAVLNGYNEVAPKDGSRILVTTDSGAPAVTVWNYFNGRVASVNAFTASGLGPLLSGTNSDLVRNTILWAVGDPRRKETVSVSIDSAIVGHEAEASFTSKEPVSGNCADTPLAFARSAGDTYVFTFTPTRAGFGTACGVPYAVNEESEEWRVGISQDLREAVRISDGKEFGFDQVDEIVEQIRTVSTRVVVERTELRNPFVALALILFLLEIFIRRMTRHT